MIPEPSYYREKHDSTTLSLDFLPKTGGPKVMVALRKVAFFIFFFSPLFQISWGMNSPKNSTVTTPSKASSEEKSYKILCLGDSLTDGYGVPRDLAWPALLAKHFREAGQNHIQVVNAGLSGSTSASGPSRLQWQLKSPQKPNLLILALGANDGLRGIDVKGTRKNLEDTIKLAQQHSIKVVLAGMQMPTNYGSTYTEEFKKIFVDLAQTYQIPLIPFLLEGVATIKELNQNDGIHPNEAGYQRVVQNIIKVVSPLVLPEATQTN